MQKGLISILTLLIFLCSISYAATNNVEPINSIAAIVNNDIITQSQLDKQTQIIKTQLEQQKQQVPPAAVLKKQVLNQLINQKLQLQQAKNDGISISNEQLNAAIANIAAQNHISVAALKQQVMKQGLDYADYRQQIRQQIMINEAQRKAVSKNIIVTHNEVAQALKKIGPQLQKIPEYHLEAILVPVPSAPTPTQVDAAQQKANSIVSQLKAGSDFSTIAIADSAGNQALQGGDMGWKQLAQLPPPIAAQIAATTKGSIVGPIQTPNGFYVIKVMGIRNISTDHSVTLTHVRHILLKQNQFQTGDEVKAKLENIRKLIEHGKSFTSMAEKYSQDTHTADKGGDLGWINNDEVPPPFAKAMNNLRLRHVSQPIQTKDGWELIQVVARKKVDNSKKHLETRVQQMIYQQKFIQAVENWVQQLRGDAFIKIVS